MGDTASLTSWAVLSLAAVTAVVHTFAGPDHYLPFIALSKSNKWSLKKTLFLTFVSGIGHIGSAILLAILFSCFESKFEAWNQSVVDESRGSLAAWLLTILGFLYMCGGIVHQLRHHSHTHGGGTSQDSDQPDRKRRLLLGWSLFIIFVLGPCEALLPIIAAAAAVGKTCLFASSLLFSIATIASMITAVTLGFYGTRLFNPPWLERWSHVIAGLIIFLCGFGMLFLGL